MNWSGYPQTESYDSLSTRTNLNATVLSFPRKTIFGRRYQDNYFYKIFLGDFNCSLSNNYFSRKDNYFSRKAFLYIELNSNFKFLLVKPIFPGALFFKNRAKQFFEVEQMPTFQEHKLFKYQTDSNWPVMFYSITSVEQIFHHYHLEVPFVFVHYFTKNCVIWREIF